MPYITAIGTHLPWRRCDLHRFTGTNEDGITPTVEADRAALPRGAAMDNVLLDSRSDLPRVAVRAGIPDYGYAFRPGSAAA
jgi:hypothetical protein